MKALNFTAVEILPALLDKTKTQTIRPLNPVEGWDGIEVNEKDMLTLENNPKDRILSPAIYKKPRFKVGEKARMFWNQRSKYKWFLIKDGTPVRPDTVIGHGIKGTEKIVNGQLTFEGEFDIFPKILGEVEITEVFQIEMHKEILIEENANAMIIKGIDKELTFSERNIELPRRDGFKDFSDMFDWFDKHYDLSSSKRFSVYRFKWLGGEKSGSFETEGKGLEKRQDVHKQGRP